MPPRWFKNIKFGQDLTNLAHKDLYEHLTKKFEAAVCDITFSSTGPIIEEAVSEDEQDTPIRSICRSDTSTNQDQVDVSSITRDPSIALDPSIARSLATEGSRAIEGSQAIEGSEISISRDPSIAREQSNFRDQTAELCPRRSRRKRWAPLDFARGERPIYKRVGATYEVVGFEPGFPAKYNYGRRKGTSKQMPKHTPPPNTKTVTPLEFRQAKKGDYLFNCLQNNSLITGAIRLRPGKQKPEAKTGFEHVYLFLVRTGQVVFKIIEDNKSTNLYANGDSGWVTLNAGVRYSVKNCGTQISDIYYIVTDRNKI